jgi:phosphate transport system substrate-binding protein
LHLKKFTCLAAAVAATTGPAVFAASAQAAAPTLNGAGSTLVAPLEAEWAQGFLTETGGDSVIYNPVGSGTGITDIQNNLVDFGASDAPLTNSQFGQCSQCIQIPWALSATGIGFNLSGIHSLRLTGQILAQIYLGHINNWDNSAIDSLNKGEHFPNLAITPIHRLDGSGDTYAFTDYLSDVSHQWATGQGLGTKVSFPVGPGANKNAGVTSTLESTNGGIAYIAVSYLIDHHLAAAAVENRAGKYEYPNINEIEDAARSVHSVPASNAIPIVNPPKAEKTAYPISTFTYVIVHKNATQGALLKQWINYCLGPGQAFGPRLDFATLPNVVKSADKNSVNEIQ